MSVIQPSVDKIQVVCSKTGRLSASYKVTRRVQLAPVWVIWDMVDDSSTAAVLRIVDGCYYMVALVVRLTIHKSDLNWVHVS